MKSLGMFRIMRLVRSAQGSKRRRGLTARCACTLEDGRARRGPRSRRRLCGGGTATLPSAGGGAAGEARPAVAGGAGNTSWYGNDVGRDVVGEMGGLGAVAASTERGDGWLVAACLVSPAAFTPQGAAVAAGAGTAAGCIFVASSWRWRLGLQALGAGPEGAVMAIVAPCGTMPPWNKGPCIPGTQGTCCGMLQQGRGGGAARWCGHGTNSSGGRVQTYVMSTGAGGGGGGIHGAPLLGM